MSEMSIHDERLDRLPTDCECTIIHLCDRCFMILFPSVEEVA